MHDRISSWLLSIAFGHMLVSVLLLGALFSIPGGMFDLWYVRLALTLMEMICLTASTICVSAVAIHERRKK